MEAIMNAENFGEIMREYRKTMNWSQEETAFKIGYSVDTISAWERGKRKPRNHEIPRLAHLLGMDAEKLAIKIRGEQPQNISANGKETPWGVAFDTWGELQQIFRTRTEFSREISYSKLLNNAQHVLAVGISLNAIALNYDKQSIIDSIVERNCKYQLCFLDPDGKYSAIRTEEEEYADNSTLAFFTGVNMKNIQGIQRFLRKKNEAYAENIEVRRYDLLPRFNIYIVDDTLMTVEWYAYERGEDTPTFVLKRQSNKGLFEFYANAAKHVLEKSKVDVSEEGK